MNVDRKIILAHMGFFDHDCTEHYQENSREVCAISTKKRYINIIELDVRKSKDGVLYCYHGTLFQYHILLRFPMNFSTIKGKYNVDKLKDILDVITEDKIVFLDIKDTSINRGDILDAFKGRKFKEVILGNRSVSFLRKFNKMPKNFVKILNGNIFCKFYDLKKLKQENFKYFEVVFPFQVSHRLIECLKKKDLELRCAGLFFLSKKNYYNFIKKYNIKHISSDFITTTENVK